jgi:outer membrane protein assembly factor BamB
MKTWLASPHLPFLSRVHPLAPTLVAVGVAFLMVAFLPPAGVGLPGAGQAGSSSGLGFSAVTPPTIAVHEGFKVTSSSATSAAFKSVAGETIVVFASVFGQNTVGITDTSNDHFTDLASATQHTPLGYNSLGIFAAYNIALNAHNSITATLSGTSADNAAIDLVVVGGVGPTPLDHLGTLTTYSTAKSAENATTAISASAYDLVLGAVGAHETRNWVATTSETALDDVHSKLVRANMTGADFSRVANAAGTVWINASAVQATTYWMADGLSLRGLGSPSSYRVTFSETGLPSGHAWYVTFDGSINSSTTSSVVFSDANGSDRFTVGGISGYPASPSSGSITISGKAVKEHITFGRDSSSWPTYLGEVTRDSANDADTTLSAANVANVTELWEVPNGFVDSEPVEANNTVYVGAYSGYEYAINVTTGTVLWKSYVGQIDGLTCPGSKGAGITSSATVSGGMVYVGGGNITGDWTNGTIGWYALNETTGKIAWDVTVGNVTRGGYNWASPLIADGYAYVGNSSMCDEPLVWGGLYQISLTTHQIVGFFSTTTGDNNHRGASIWGSPTYDAGNNTVFFATGNPLHNFTSLYSESVVAINATTLAPLGSWQVPAAQTIHDSDFGTTPTYFHLANGTPMVVAENKNGIVYALDARNLTAGPVWETVVSNATTPQNVAPLSWGGGLLYEGSAAGIVGGKVYPGVVRALYPGNGTPKWQRGETGDVYGAPAYSNGLVVVGGGKTLQVLDSSTGALLWSWNCSHIFESAPSIAEGRIFAACDGTYAFGLTGLVVSQPRALGGPSTPLTGRSTNLLPSGPSQERALGGGPQGPPGVQARPRTEPKGTARESGGGRENPGRVGVPAGHGSRPRQCRWNLHLGDRGRSRAGR